MAESLISKASLMNFDSLIVVDLFLVDMSRLNLLTVGHEI